MKKIGFMGAYDKANFMIYTAKVLRLLDYKVLVVDASSVQKIKYIIPAINPTKSYITSFEDIDFAVGFEEWAEVERYLGIRYDSNEDEESKINKDIYDYVLIDIDSAERLESFEMENADKNYFVTSFDMFSLKKGIDIFKNVIRPMDLTKIEFAYETSKEDEDYLNYISLEYKVNWNNYVFYFQILGEDNKVFEENQRLEKIRFRRLSIGYKETLSYVIQDICKNENPSKIKRTMKD
ncbi:MAG: hypothetical protein V8R39_04550 [Clostridia bacterium]